MSYNSTHIMQLPRTVIVGNNILKNCGIFINESNLNAKKLAIITGPKVKGSSIHCGLQGTSVSLSNTSLVFPSKEGSQPMVTAARDSGRSCVS